MDDVASATWLAMIDLERLVPETDRRCEPYSPMEIHAFDAIGGPCACGKYASWADYVRRERSPLPPGAQASWRRGIWR